VTECYYSYYDEIKENPTLGLTLFADRPSLSSELDWFAQNYKKMADGDGVFMVAEVDSHVVGVCEVERVTYNPEVSHRGELGLAIRKEYRGKGVGTALLGQTLERCKGKFEIIQLSVFSINQMAKSLYEKFHFKSIGVRPRSIKRGDRYFDEDIMILVL